MSLLGDFKKFLFRGNVVDLAVAVVVGTAFTAVVKALDPKGTALEALGRASFFIATQEGFLTY